eukprot:gene15600-18495_t
MASRKLIRMDLDTEVLHKLAMRNIHTAKTQDNSGNGKLVERNVFQHKAQNLQNAVGHSDTEYSDIKEGTDIPRITEMVGPAGIGKTQWCQRIAESVMVLSPKTTAELLERLKSMETVIIERRVKLILLDSVAALPRAEYGSGKEAIVQRQEALGQLASTLKALAEAFGIPVVVTNQVTTTGDLHHNELLSKECVSSRGF